MCVRFRRSRLQVGGRAGRRPLQRWGRAHNRKWGERATLGKLLTSVPQFPHLSSKDVIVVTTTQGGLE